MNIIAPTSLAARAPIRKFFKHERFPEEWWIETDQAKYIANVLI